MASLSTVYAEPICATYPPPCTSLRRPRLRVALLGATPAVIAMAATLMAAGAWCVLTPDMFRYFQNARSLVETGHFPSGQLVRPPGYPVLIAPLFLLGDLPFLPVRLFLGGCWATTSVLTYFLHRRRLGETAAWMAAALVATNGVFFMQTTTALSEPVFTALSMAVLLLLSRWWSEPPRRAGETALGGLLLAATCLVRTIGIVFVPLMAVALLKHRCRTLRARLGRLAVFAVCAAGPLIAWQVRQSAYPAIPKYFNHFTAARAWEHTQATGLALQVERVITLGPIRLADIKAAMLPAHLGWRAFIPPLESPASWIVGMFFVLAAVLGLLRRRSPVDAYVLLTLCVLVLWPWRDEARFVSPLIPIFCGYAVAALIICAGRIRSVRLRRAGLVAAAVFALGVQGAELLHVRSGLGVRERRIRERMVAMRDLARWQDEHLRPGESWLAVTPKGHMTKTLLAGSAYLARRSMQPFDVVAELPASPPSNHARAIIHESFFADVVRKWGYVPVTRLHEFVVFARPAS